MVAKSKCTLMKMRSQTVSTPNTHSSYPTLASSYEFFIDVLSTGRNFRMKRAAMHYKDMNQAKHYLEVQLYGVCSLFLATILNMVNKPPFNICNPPKYQQKVKDIVYNHKREMCSVYELTELCLWSIEVPKIRLLCESEG
jgi:hypothetical protein